MSSISSLRQSLPPMAVDTRVLVDVVESAGEDHCSIDEATLCISRDAVVDALMSIARYATSYPMSLGMQTSVYYPARAHHIGSLALRSIHTGLGALINTQF